MYPNPNYVDGLQAVVALSAYCYNNGATYMCYSGDPSLTAPQTELQNSDKQLIGSVTYGSPRKGTLQLQYKLAVDEIPSSQNQILPSFIIAFRGRYYVAGEPKTTIVKNDVIKIAVPVTELANPFVPNLLSTIGQQLARNQAHASGFTQSAAASGTRTGSTLAYSLETFGSPGTAAPTGFTINASTGLITYDGSQPAGSYDLRVIVADTVTLPDGTTDVVYGFGRLTATLT